MANIFNFNQNEDKVDFTSDYLGFCRILRLLAFYTEKAL